MQSADFFDHTLEFASKHITDVAQESMQNVTACSQWDVRTLLNHMVYELLWMPDLLAGKTVEEVGDAYEGDVLGNDVHKSWAEASRLAAASVKRALSDQVVHLSYGDVPAQDYICEVATDVLIHTWDLGRGLNRTVLLAPELAQTAYDYIVPKLDDYRAAGMLGPVISFDEADPIAVKLLASAGRDAHAV